MEIGCYTVGVLVECQCVGELKCVVVCVFAGWSVYCWC